MPRSERGELFVRLLSLFEPGKMVDLGTGHGGFAMEAADLGWDVTAVDARTERWPNDDRITWVQSDVRDHNLAPYDLVACLGVFYHLTLDDQLDLLARASGRPMIIDTHLDHGEHEHDLSEPVEVADGYLGRRYSEPGQLTSAWRNRESFWPTLGSFHRMLRDRGFYPVLTVEPWVSPDRTFFLALPDRTVDAS